MVIRYFRRLFHTLMKKKTSFVCYIFLLFLVFYIAGGFKKIQKLREVLKNVHQMNLSSMNNVIFNRLIIRPENCVSSSLCWESKDFDQLTGSQILQYFLWTNRPSCQLVHDFGGVLKKDPSGLDGQKAVCIDPKIAPAPNKCLVYSFGIDNDWSFDEHMELYGCQVFSFDPTMKKKPHDHKPRIHFYDWGISHLNENRTHDDNSTWQMFTLSSIYHTLSNRHGNVIIDYLKMDIESEEWQVLPQIIESGMLSKVRQLGVEVHLPEEEPIDKYREFAKVLQQLEKHGMVRFDSKYNPWSAGEFYELNLSGAYCYEIAWYNNQLRYPLRNIKSKFRNFLNGFQLKKNRVFL